MSYDDGVRMPRSHDRRQSKPPHRQDATEVAEGSVESHEYSLLHTPSPYKYGQKNVRTPRDRLRVRPIGSLSQGKDVGRARAG
jgi:hypothetical protein